MFLLVLQQLTELNKNLAKGNELLASIDKHLGELIGEGLMSPEDVQKVRAQVQAATAALRSDAAAAGGT